MAELIPGKPLVAALRFRKLCKRWRITHRFVQNLLATDRNTVYRWQQGEALPRGHSWPLRIMHMLCEVGEHIANTDEEAEFAQFIRANTDHPDTAYLAVWAIMGKFHALPAKARRTDMYAQGEAKENDDE